MSSLRAGQPEASPLIFKQTMWRVNCPRRQSGCLYRWAMVMVRPVLFFKHSVSDRPFHLAGLYNDARYRVMGDAGWFLDHPTAAGAETIRSEFQYMAHMMNSSFGEYL